ncbi:MAG: PrsW family intramembrane metalloprotease [Clostridia bacterium]|nr:PrsW family intramembrane metalloprotease [Clostridia bacterium]
MMSVIFVLAAVLPAFVLMRYIYRQDSVESEPQSLLLRLAIAGALAIFPVILLEMAGQYMLDLILPSTSSLYSILLMFLIVAPVEEGCKYYFLKKRTWSHPAFNYRFDGVVYAVFVSLGFAAVENIGYVMQFGLSVALTRAVFSIPAHMGFAVFMGTFYGRAKVCEGQGNAVCIKSNLRTGLFIAIIFHGFYNTCLALDTPASLMIFIAFAALMYVIVFLRIKNEAASDIKIETEERFVEMKDQLK